MKKILHSIYATIIAMVIVFDSTIIASAEEYIAKRGDSWWKIANSYGITATELAAANGKTIGDTLLIGQKVKIPSASLSSSSNNTKTATGSTTSKYTAKSGDSWYRIANKYGISVSVLAAANGRTINDYLLIGEEIMIPAANRSSTSTEGTTTVQSSYTVKSGDSWYRIANKYGISASALASANGCTIRDYLIAGEKIAIPAASSSSTEGTATVQSSYTVKSGDSWYGIATKFGCSAIALAKMNGNRSVYDTIYAGETIAIPSSKTGTAVSNVLSTVTLYNSPYGNSWYNIQLAAKTINGLTLAPGQSFSWASYVGPCGQADGYKLAGVYANGQSAQGYGGGVCFVSTTLMQVARSAGMIITEKHDHSLPVKYASRGNEASVSYGSWDLKFVNTTGSTVTFTAVANSTTGALTITCSAS